MTASSSRFSLRLYQNTEGTHTNRNVGPFVPRGEIHVREMSAAPHAASPWSYQIYPGNSQHSTFFTLRPGCLLWLFTDPERLLGKARTSDEYIYFCPKEEDKTLYLVEAPTEQEALDKLKKNLHAL